MVSVLWETEKSVSLIPKYRKYRKYRKKEIPKSINILHMLFGISETQTHRSPERWCGIWEVVGLIPVADHPE